MPTVDRKNDTDEKHSLSSFDKRKVQSVTFGARGRLTGKSTEL